MVHASPGKKIGHAFLKIMKAERAGVWLNGRTLE
jgi:hypothetical protein